MTNVRTAEEAELEAPVRKSKKLRQAGQHRLPTARVIYERGKVANTVGLPRGAHQLLEIAEEELPPHAARAFLRCKLTMLLDEFTCLVRSVRAESTDPDVSDGDLQELLVECMLNPGRFQTTSFESLRRAELNTALQAWKRAFPDALAPQEPFPPPPPAAPQEPFPPPPPTAERVEQLRAGHIHRKFQKIQACAVEKRFPTQLPGVQKKDLLDDLVEDAAALAALKVACAAPGRFGQHLVQCGAWVMQ